MILSGLIKNLGNNRMLAQIGMYSRHIAKTTFEVRGRLCRLQINALAPPNEVLQDSECF